MEQGIVFLFITVIFYAVYRREIHNPVVKHDLNSIFIIIVFALIAPVSIALKIMSPDSRWFFAAAWPVAGVLVYGKSLKKHPLAAVYIFLFGLSILSFFILPYNRFTPYIFPASGFIFLLIAAEIHKDILSKFGVYGMYFFTLAAAFTVKLFMLGQLPYWISVPVTVLAALFLCMRNTQGLDFYMDEKTGLKTAAMLYVVLIIQCFAAAMLKNPFFN